MTYRQGEIVWVHFPFTDLSGNKLRPALIISNQVVNRTGDYLMMQVTSKLREDNLSLSLEPDSFLGTALLKPTQLRLHKIFILNSRLIESRIAVINPTFFAIVIGRLNALLQVD